MIVPRYSQGKRRLMLATASSRSIALPVDGGALRIYESSKRRVR